MDLCQVFGQGQNTEGEEERATWVALVYAFCAQHRVAAVRKEGPASRISGHGVGKEPGTVLGHCFKKDLPLDGVEGVFKVKLEQDMVRCCLLQPHPNFVHQGFSPAEYPDSNLLGLKATGRFRLVAPNKKLTCQTAKRLADSDRPHSPAPLAQGDEAGPCQGSQALGEQTTPGKVAAEPRDLLQHSEIGRRGPLTP